MEEPPSLSAGMTVGLAGVVFMGSCDEPVGRLMVPWSGLMGLQLGLMVPWPGPMVPGPRPDGSDGARYAVSRADRCKERNEQKGEHGGAAIIDWKPYFPSPHCKAKLQVKGAKVFRKNGKRMSECVTHRGTNGNGGGEARSNLTSLRWGLLWMTFPYLPASRCAGIAAATVSLPPDSTPDIFSLVSLEKRKKICVNI